MNDLAPADTWWGVLLDGFGGATLGGLTAGFAAWLAVHLTQKGDEGRARLTASQGAAANLQPHVLQVMSNVGIALGALHILGAVFGHVTDWRTAARFERPVLSDAELGRRVDRYTELLGEAAQRSLEMDSKQHLVTGSPDERPVWVPELAAWAEQTLDALGTYSNHLMDSLIAHRAFAALPPAVQVTVPPKPTTLAG